MSTNANQGVLKSGQTLLPTDPHRAAINQGLVSPNGLYQLQYQNDGNLVLYKSAQPSRDVIESAGTNRPITRENSYGEMSADGRLKILYLTDNKKEGYTWETVWETVAKGPKDCNLYLNDEGQLYFAMNHDGEKTPVNIANGTVNNVN
jgi:hypothetical protein